MISALKGRVRTIGHYLPYRDRLGQRIWHSFPSSGTVNDDESTLLHGELDQPEVGSPHAKVPSVGVPVCGLEVGVGSWASH
jgi:hypothetical protein